MSAFIISLPALERNALILRDVADAAGCRIALALKGFSCWPCFEALSPWLDGCCAERREASPAIWNTSGR